MLRNISEQRYIPKKKVRELYSKQELVGRGAYGAVYKGYVVKEKKKFL